MTSTYNDSSDFFTDESIHDNPYPYYEHLRAKCPIAHDPVHNMLAVTGWQEAVEIYKDNETFSSCNATTGPFSGLNVVPGEHDDISDLIEEARPNLIMHEHIFTMDPPEHTQHRGLLMRLFTPKRLHENEEFMWGLADRLIDEFIDEGKCEFIAQYAQSFAMLVIADLLGVPEEVHRLFREQLGLVQRSDEAARDNPASYSDNSNTLSFLDSWFIEAIEERRREPRDDMLSTLANATFKDGSIPEVIEIVRPATLLFAAGQETTARLLATALKYLAEDPELQDKLRGNDDLVANFVEEALRVESPIKSDFRLARRKATVAGVEIPAGSTIMILNGAANRDPRHFECPAEVRLDRPNAKEHVAFGRGAHACPGGPLTRVEARVSIARILERMRDIRLDESHHGTAGDRRFDYEPNFIIRGLRELHLQFTPVREARGALTE